MAAARTRPRPGGASATQRAAVSRRQNLSQRGFASGAFTIEKGGVKPVVFILAEQASAVPEMLAVRRSALRQDDADAVRARPRRAEGSSAIPRRSIAHQATIRRWGTAPSHSHRKMRSTRRRGGMRDPGTPDDDDARWQTPEFSVAPAHEAGVGARPPTRCRSEQRESPALSAIATTKRAGRCADEIEKAGRALSHAGGPPLHGDRRCSGPSGPARPRFLNPTRSRQSEVRIAGGMEIRGDRGWAVAGASCSGALRSCQGVGRGERHPPPDPAWHGTPPQGPRGAGQSDAS
jgi:hypothetical protein